jgi:hypothetical protein
MLEFLHFLPLSNYIIKNLIYKKKKKISLIRNLFLINYNGSLYNYYLTIITFYILKLMLEEQKLNKKLISLPELKK